MWNLRQASNPGGVHGLRQGLSQGVLQVLRLQKENRRKILREEWKAVLLKGFRGNDVMRIFTENNVTNLFPIVYHS